MSESRLTLPNIVTVARIVVAPLLAWLALAPDFWSRLAAFVLFVIAALSDVWDGWWARKHGLVTDVGKLLDPLADKLLMAATFIPFYVISHRGVEAELIPGWGALPVWVLIVIFGREIFITLFRSYAAGREVIIAAGKSGKQKALLQALFMGGLLLWYPVRMLAESKGWEGAFWGFWYRLHTSWIEITLWLALVLTIYSMLDYLWSYRSVVGLRS